MFPVIVRVRAVGHVNKDLYEVPSYDRSIEQQIPESTSI